ncbi:MAG: hypothetical protein IJV31_05240 [Clostridia bacterium]|nr:hypothetical protein [Clostridia bacterium]
MRKVKCLEYYFKPNVTREQIDEEIQENIKKLKRISKIIDTKIEIQTSEIGTQIVRAYIVQEEKKSLLANIKQKIQDLIEKKQRLTLPENEYISEEKIINKTPKIPNFGNGKSKEKLIDRLTKMQKQPDSKFSKTSDTNVKIEMEMQVKKYGNYKPGGKFKPFESNKKRKKFP